MIFTSSPQGNSPMICPTCGMQCIVLRSGEMRCSSPRSHRKFIRLKASNGVQNNVGRAANKRKGWTQFLHGSTLDERVEGALLIMRAHYDRDLIGSKAMFSFEEWAASYNVERAFGVMPKVVEVIRRLFPS